MKFDIAGKSIESILAMDFNELQKLQRKDFARVTSRLVSAVNKRLKRLETSPEGQQSPAYISRMEAGGKLSVRNKNLNELRETFREAKEFLNKKTSSRRGWAGVKKATTERITPEIKKYKTTYSDKYTEKQVTKRISQGLNTAYKSRKFWETYRRLEETGVHLGIGDGSERIQKEVMKYYAETGWRGSIDEAIDNISNQSTEIYEEEVEQNVSNFANAFILEEE